MAAGVNFGRKWKLSDYQRAEAIRRRKRWRDTDRDRQELRRRHIHDLSAVERPAIAPASPLMRHSRDATRVSACSDRSRAEPLIRRRAGLSSIHLV
jgi:hypothetical protein